MKTIFYIKSEDETGDHWFGQIPYVEWFTLEKTLYEPNGRVVKRTIIEKDDKKYIQSVNISHIQETFSEDGIIRRIALRISNN